MGPAKANQWLAHVSPQHSYGDDAHCTMMMMILMIMMIMTTIIMIMMSILVIMVIMRGIMMILMIFNCGIAQIAVRLVSFKNA